MKEILDSLSEKERKLEAQRMEIHAAMVDNMDQNIGRVLDKLQEQGELENKNKEQREEKTQKSVKQEFEQVILKLWIL